MTVWHVDEATAARYATGDLPEPDAWSLEKHVERCSGCAGRISRAVRAGDAGPVLAEVRGAVLAAALAPDRVPEAPRPSRLRSLRSAWAAGPALRGAWAVAVLLVAAGAVALAYGAGLRGGRTLLLALAPVMPVLGVAVSYGRHADPLHELNLTSPSGGLRLLLLRTAAVLAVSAPLLTTAGLLLPGSSALEAAAWLLPGLALTLASLVLAGFTGCRTATALVGAGWLCAVAAPAVAGDGGGTVEQLADRLSLVLDGATAQVVWAAGAALCAALLAARRSSYDRLEQR